jgi:hypothetical protein
MALMVLVVVVAVLAEQELMLLEQLLVLVALAIHGLTPVLLTAVVVAVRIH